MTVDSAAQIALLNNPNLQATFEDLGIAQADLVQAGLLKNPVFSIGVRFPDRSPGKTYLDIGVAEDFLDIALLPARKKLAAIQFEATRFQVTAKVLELVADVSHKFYVYQAACMTVELRRSTAEAAEAGFHAFEAMKSAGNISDLDFAAQQSMQARAEMELGDAEAERDADREDLNAAMGLWDDSSHWRIVKDFSPLPEIDPPVADLEKLALEQRADLAAARQDILAQARKLGVTKQYAMIQNLDLGPEAERETDGQWRIGPSISLPVPLFDQGQASVARAQAMLRQTAAKYRAAAIAARSEVRLAHLRLTSARKRAELYHDRILPLEIKLMEQSHLQYNGMLTGLFQLLQIRRDQIDASAGYIAALRDYWTARVALEEAVGGRISTTNATTRKTFSAQTRPDGGMP